jgi:ABC-type uncharacterized transport system substrate-binding protein
MPGMRRREFVSLLGGAAAAWPLAARAQQGAMPVIGFLHRESLTPTRENYIAAMRRGLAEHGYIEGSNLAIEYRWAEGKTDRLADLAADLVRRNVNVIVTPANTPAALAAKSATQTIPIVFFVGTDPVESGLVQSLNRPGENITGVSLIDVEVVAKRIQLLHELMPTATSFALLVNPKNPITSRAETREAQLAANALGLHLLVLEAGISGDIPDTIAAFVRQQASALLVSNDILFSTVQDQLIDLAMRHKIVLSIPEVLAVRKGALLAYAPDVMAAWREVGVYAGRILKGEKPSDLPVQRSVKVSLIINLKTAKALGLQVPPSLLARADEVIE